MSYVFSFSTRADAMRFMDGLTEAGGKGTYVNSPASGEYGCGLAVKSPDLELCERVLGDKRLSGLRAVYTFDNGTYKRIYRAGISPYGRYN